MIYADYRGKRADNGEWINKQLCELAGLYFIAEYPEGAGFSKDTNVKIITGWHEVVKSTIGQYTGRRDFQRTKEYPKGQKIYGGDWVAGENEWGKFGPQDVIWDSEHAAWIVPCRINKTVKNPVENYQNFLYQLWDLKVIGNIHDNPELLESK